MMKLVDIGFLGFGKIRDII